MTPIKIGPSQGESTAVTSGLTVGAQVVVDGADKLKDNAKISLRPESPAVPNQGEDTSPPSNPGPPTSAPAPDFGNGAPGSAPAGAAPAGDAPAGTGQ